MPARKTRPEILKTAAGSIRNRRRQHIKELFYPSIFNKAAHSNLKHPGAVPAARPGDS